MGMERMWDIASMMSAIVGLFISSVLVVKFYSQYVKKFADFIIGTVFFAVMSLL
ncbi:MAG: hypothetical protein K6G84_12965 [Lachnospiraceae bacterium]|nr:hypothetical protein [Lachnospiraceae bacterium]